MHKNLHPALHYALCMIPNAHQNMETDADKCQLTPPLPALRTHWIERYATMHRSIEVHKNLHSLEHGASGMISITDKYMKTDIACL